MNNGKSMEKLVIQEEVKNCPLIVFYPEIRMLKVTGRSIPENPEPVYSNLARWIAGHLEKNGSLDITIQLEYINSGSSRHLYDLLRRMESYVKRGKRVSIKWRYEEDDEAILDLGTHFRDNAGIPLDIEMIK
jgi:hypothetical protein